MKRRLTALAGLLACAAVAVGAEEADRSKAAEKSEKKSPFSSETFSGIKLREIGPAVFSGRIADIAVVPGKPSAWVVAVASGGVWKTTNAGTTWTPVFDAEASYSIGCVTVDPQNPNAIWVGTGENNSQRSVGYGDGVYKSLDGGKSWKNMGLKSVRAHREDPRRPEELRRRLRRGAGPALGVGRRTRRLQDGRRRQDVEGRRSRFPRTRARRTSGWTRATRASSTRRRTSAAATSGGWCTAGPRARSGRRRTRARRGESSRRASRRRTSGGSASPCRPRTRTFSTRSSRRRTRRTAGRTARTTAARAGRARASTRRTARSTTRSSSPTRRRSTASTRWTPSTW